MIAVILISIGLFITAISYSSGIGTTDSTIMVMGSFTIGGLVGEAILQNVVKGCAAGMQRIIDEGERPVKRR